PEALPVLKRLAHARLVFRRRSRDLRALARRAVVAIEGQAGEGQRAPTPQAS
ncbi:MAG: hypothetical protein HY334_00380, partial [Armatimonadetes bacterium]|nr:hypothetical protein [Armatimonadota bacterium]